MSGQGQSHEHDPRWTTVDEYAVPLLHTSKHLPAQSSLDHALATSKNEGLPDIAVSASQGKLLQLQARSIRAKNILEVGTLGGYSTIWLANATPNSKVVSVEVDEHHAKVARANIANAGVPDRVEVHLGAGIEILPKLVEEVKAGKREKFQFVFIDADKENNWNYVDIALGMVESGGVIIVDNVVRKGQLAHNVDDPRVQGARRVVENIGKDDRLEGVVIQTVGDKNYDGFLFAVVK